MDLGFSRFDTLRSEAVPAPLDYVRLIASLAAMQAASRTAATEAALAAGTRESVRPAEAIVTLLVAGPGWADAVATLEGSFHPGIAARRLIGPP